MSKFCDKCGAELKNENAKFCDKCGAEVKVTTNQNNAINYGGVIVCPRCGQTTPMGMTHCEKCGSPFEDNTKAVIVGYILTFIFPLLGLIPAIYLLTRNTGKAKTQGVLLIGINILIFLIWYIFSPLINFIITILLIVAGIYLWHIDYSIF